MATITLHEAEIQCCKCGQLIRPNAASMCPTCLREEVDITEGIPRQLILHECRGCGRYMRPPWVNAAPESAELLALCLRRLPQLKKKVKLTDARFIWTEPHSRRLRVQVTVQKEVMHVIMQQTFEVEFLVQNQTCDDCTRAVSNQTWRASVQLRQRVDHKRTIFWLEQLILKHQAHSKCTTIQQMPGGIDFFFSERSHARSFIEFLQSIAPVRSTMAKKLISHNIHESTYNYKFTFMIEVVPVCKDDLVLLPKRLANSLGSMGQVALVARVSNIVHVVEPWSLRAGELSADVYWRQPFQALASRQHMTEFVVLDVEMMNEAEAAAPAASRVATRARVKHALARVEVVRERDFGVNDTRFNVVTHLGALLKAGDTVLGYDMTTVVYSEEHAKILDKRDAIPDVVLVRKHYPRRRRKAYQRHWKLQELPMQAQEGERRTEVARREHDYEMFLRDIEEDRDMRSQINLFRDAAFRGKQSRGFAFGTAAAAEAEEDEEDFPEVPLEELLDEMTLEDRAQADGAAAAAAAAAASSLAAAPDDAAAAGASGLEED